MTFLLTTTLALSLASQESRCKLPDAPPGEVRVFTNADLERMAACRYETGVLSQETGARSETPVSSRRGKRMTAIAPTTASSDLEQDWRAQWQAIDQKARHLREEARELRQEAAEAPRDPKKRPTGRRAPSLLQTRAERLESEARRLEEEFADRARRGGALPGWLRPSGR